MILAFPAAAIAEPEPSVPKPPAPGLELAFSDEFDGETLSPRWATTFPDGKRSLDKESQSYMDRDAPTRPFRLSDGILSVTATRVAEGDGPGTYASGLLSSFGSYGFTYGYVEARVRIPSGHGLWPAFWLFRDDGLKEGAPYGEIDIMEILAGTPDTAYATLHAGPQWEGRRIAQAKAVADEPYSDAFHVFAVDWGERETVFLIDGKETARFQTPPEAKADMHILLNLAVGGPWGGPPDETTPASASMQVDWVRVWKRPDAEPR